VITGALLSACGSAPSEVTIGQGIRVKGSSLSPHLRATSTTVTPPTKLVALSPTLRLSPTGPLPSPVTVTIPLTVAVPTADVVVIATAEAPSGPWTYLPAELSSDRKSVSFTTSHFSWYDVFGLDVKSAFDTFKTAFLDGLDGGATMSVTQPSCSGTDQALANGYSVKHSTTDTVYWCFGMDGNHEVLKVVNNRRYPLEVAHPNLSVVQPGSIDWGQLASLSHLGSSQNSIIAPGDAVTYQVNIPNPGRGGIQTEMDGLGQSLYALQVGVESLVSILTRFGVGGPSAGFDTASKFLGIASCADAMNRGAGAIISGCFSPSNLVSVFGTAGLLLAPVVAFGGLVAFFHSEWNALVDQFEGHDEYTVQIDRTGTISSPPCSASTFSPIATAATGSGGTSTVVQFACSGSWALISGQTTFAPGSSGPEIFVGLLEWSNAVWTVVGGLGDGSCLAATSTSQCPYPPDPPLAIPHSLLLSLASSAGLLVDSGGSIYPPPTGPSGPGYQAATQEWLMSPSVSGSYDQNVPLLQAITDLQNGLSTDRNTSGYAAAISELQSLTQLPDAMLTPAQDAEETMDQTALDTFFNTPNLY
jgi:hypothetical protein